MVQEARDLFYVTCEGGRDKWCERRRTNEDVMVRGRERESGGLDKHMHSLRYVHI